MVDDFSDVSTKTLFATINTVYQYTSPKLINSAFNYALIISEYLQGNSSTLETIKGKK